nr:hypothetical protein CFP56_12843 [Quercus suber]
MALALRLLRLGCRTSAEQESLNCHFSPGHHLDFLTSLGCLWLGWSSWSFLLFNRYMDLTTLRHWLSRFVPHWGKECSTGVRKANGYRREGEAKRCRCEGRRSVAGAKEGEASLVIWRPTSAN